MPFRLVLLLLCGAPLLAQQQAPPVTRDGMKVQINVLNVCTPAPEERQGIAAALERLPRQPRFAPDFEVSRGRTTLPDAPVSHWVRLRREFPGDSEMGSVQYSLSVDEKSIIETLVFRVRDPKDVLQVAIEDHVSAAAAAPGALLASDTPATRVKVERFGQKSLALARCADADQAAYQPLFDSASGLLARYRKVLRVRQVVTAELVRLGVAARPASPPKTR